MEKINMDDTKIENKQEEKVEYVTKKDFEALQNILLEALGKKEKEEVKPTFDSNLETIKKENLTKEQMKNELVLDEFFEDANLYNYTEDEKRAMVNVSKEELELINMNKLSSYDDINKFMSKAQQREIDNVLKNGSKQDKINFKYTFLDYFKEAKDKFDEFNLQKEKELGVELSKKGYTKQGSNNNKFTIDKVNDSGLKKLLANIDSKYFN
jgi:hypothetical protein